MHQSISKPHSLSLLAGAMAAVASGQALAEVAGKVSFVTGNVTATAADGQSRTLTRGAMINGGDRIETRGGRLQIRFTDGSFVALQPNTVFGVDQYVYANKAPQDTSLFFSLLRGGMRTVTGAIGKVNKQSYKVRTPVATIGIRGTGYRATTDNNRTLVSVGAGLVNVGNGFGDITGSAGQNILVTNEQPPVFTREAAEIAATRPEGDREDGVPEDDDTAAFGDQTQSGGAPLLATFDPATGTFTPNPAFITPVQSPLTDGPGYTLAETYFWSMDSNILADFDGSGALVSALNETNSPATQQLVNVSATISDVSTYKNLSWGRFSNGDVIVSSEIATLSGSSNLHYVIGMATSSAAMSALVSQGGSATYAVTGYTTPSSNTSVSGSVSGSLNVNFANSLVNANLAITNGAATYNVSGGMSIADYKFSGFGLSTSSTAFGSCISGCFTNINGFFAGEQAEQIGLTYEVNDSWANTIVHGAAALEKQ